MSESKDKQPTVFISYSHDSRKHADRVLDLADRLVMDGIDIILDQYEESPAEGWPRWMDKHIRDAEFVIMICTEIYYKRVIGDEKEGNGLGVKWEGNLIYQHIYNTDTTNTRFLPVLFGDGKVEHIPTPLQGTTYYRVDTAEGYESLYRRLTNQPRAIKPKIGKKKKLPPRKRKQDFFAQQVTLAKLPVTGKDLFGRDAEIKLLDEAWEAEHTHIVSLVAWGGVGKSALVNEWLNRMEANNWRGAERVYGWSFYSQGTREDRQVSSDEFLAHALEWFGDEETAGSTKSAWDKGVRLAELVREQRTLLILDGMEPLQYPPGAMQGRLKDQGLQALLKELSHGNSGMCVITTRVKVADIENTVDKTTKRVWLENLSDDAGAQVLKNLGVKGTKKELLDTSREFKGHALALNLLGSYLATVHGGEIRKKDLVPALTKDEKKGGHAKRVMESYEIWLKGRGELDILYLMGLFDRPADEGAIKVLREKPVIKGLTENIAKLSEAKWKFAVKNLRELRLLAEKESGEELDCHPLIREHFGEKLKEDNPDGWREAHGKLYEYYRGLPEKELPDTLEEMEPLFIATYHGCQAGRHQEILVDVFWERIRRGKEQYTYHKLGAFGADLSALAGFFEECWSKPAAGLSEGYKALVLSWAGFALKAVGRLREAVEPMKAGLEARINQKVWESATINAGILSGLYLTLGEIERSVEYARKSVKYADESGDAFSKMAYRTALGDALHQAGDIGKAEELFRKAEEMQRKRQPGYEYLYSFQGYKFCDLFLSQGKYGEVQKRAEKTLGWAKQRGILLDIGLDNLSSGRAYMLEVSSEGRGEFGKAREYLERAVEGLRKAGTQDQLPLGLLARAKLNRLCREFDAAWRDLEEAREIAERGEMRLYMADCALEGSRLFLAQKQKAKAKEELKRAKELIEECGYHRRDRDLKSIINEL